MQTLLILLGDRVQPITSVNQTVGVIVWIGMIVFTVAFFVLSWTKLGSARPLVKCLTLSVFAHVVLAIFFYGTKMLGLDMNLSGDQTVTISLISESELETAMPVNESEDSDVPIVEEQFPEQWDERDPLLPDPQEFVENPEQVTELPSEVEQIEMEDPGVVAENDPAEPVTPFEQSDDSEENDPVIPVNEDPVMEPADDGNGVEVEPETQQETELVAGPEVASPVSIPDSQSEDMVEVQQVAASDIPDDPFDSQVESENVPQTPRRLDGKEIPELYRARYQSSAGQKVRGISFGATPETEAAVRAGIEWLVQHQHENGQWDASEYGAGVDREVDGQQRGSTGANADTGVSGLALLALMGDGHTHLSGKHRVVVQHGLEYLLGQQGRDGNLSGNASLFARMYCHAMATIAVCEAYALTGDNRLRDYAEKAVGYTIRSQDLQSGGWRYQPADAGDMSQFGWQVLALRSAQQAGLVVPQKTKDLMAKFLASCNTGARGGLASYRPGFKATRTMTAESLACRMWLQTHDSVEQIDEASNYIVRQLPSRSNPDLYYWYYGSLSLRQVGGPAWETWSNSLKQIVPSLQWTDGSWAADTKWGGYGGKVYSTAMAVLCLESFYRYQ